MSVPRWREKVKDRALSILMEYKNKYMKRIFSLLLLAMLSHLYVAAKLEGSGYYRIWNAAVLAQNKEKAYCCVSCNTYHMSTASGADQKIISIPLYPEQYSFTDPSAIIYVQMPDATHKFDLSAQGVWVSQLLDGSSLTLTGSRDGEYVLTGKVQGIESPVYSTSEKSGRYDPKYYYLTSSNSNTAYKFWGADKVDSESATNYFGVKPTLSAKGKYYAPFYVSFPFETASDGMKVYYVSKMNKSGYTLEEINGIVPAATPVLIECSSDDPSKNRLKLHEPGTHGVRIAGNKLKGVYFCNPNLGITWYPTSVTEFKPETMRIWKVENGELVLSNDGSSLFYGSVASGVKMCCLNANQSYLPVPADYATTMKEGQADPVTVTFLNDEGGILTTVEGFPGDKITLPAEPTKTGYTFAGWEGLTDVFPEESKTVKPLWTINQYTITFDSDGGNEVAPVTQDYGTAVAIPAAPTKTGHTFLGWEPAVPTTMPAENVTVKAKWQVNSYSVKFLMDDNTVLKETTQEYGTPIVRPENPAKVGAEFMGWIPEPDATVPAKDVVYTAAFTGTEYTITFDTDGAGDIEPIKGFYGTAVQKPAAPVKSGYTFLGWEPEIPATFSGNMTVKAKWQMNQYTITFDTDGGSTINPMTVDYNSTIAVNIPTKEGYTFLGWEPELPKTMPANDVTVKAKWQANKYTITFDTDGGSVVSPITADCNSAVTAPTSPTKAGYTFLGWEPELPQTMPAGNITVKAQWKANAYTITFDAAGGSAVSPITADYNTAITAPAAPVKEGYTFLGWEPELPKTMPLDGMTVKAKWQINQYTIKFNCDGGSAVSDMTQDYGTAVSAPDAPTKFGYTFAGWQPELPATVPAQNITVKAVWQAAKTGYDISLSEGWNWVSIPMMDEDMTDINTLLGNGEWELGDEVKSKTAVAAYSKRNAKWLGALAHQTKLSGTVMYKIRSAKTQGVALKEGRVTVPAEMNVTVNGGWNHISYLPAEPMLLSEALANYPAADGDVIKSETASSLYSNDKGWEGELTVLEPGQGYMLMRNAGNPVTFRYPNEAQTKVEEQPTAGTANRYADNMTVVATLAGVETEAGDSLAAIVRGELRGTSAVSEDGTTILTVQGSGSELVSIALLRGGEVFATANTSLCYEVDAVVGSLGNPAAISFVEDDDTALPFNGGNVAAIYSADGKKVNTTNYNSLPAGTYIIYAVADGKTNIIKTTKK